MRDPLELSGEELRMLSLFAHRPCEELSTLRIFLALDNLPAPYEVAKGLLERGFLARRRGKDFWEWCLGPMADALKDAGRFPGEGRASD